MSGNIACKIISIPQALNPLFCHKDNGVHPAISVKFSKVVRCTFCHMHMCIESRRHKKKYLSLTFESDPNHHKRNAIFNTKI